MIFAVYVFENLLQYMAKSNYKPWKNFQSKQSSQGSKQEIEEIVIDLKQEAPKTNVPEDTTKVIKLEKGSSALVTHSDISKCRTKSE